MDTRPMLLRALGAVGLRLLLLGVAASALPLSSAAGTGSAADRGGLIYRGDVELAARIRGHQEGLPAQASRCVNCHAISDRAAAAAPPLTPASLEVAQPRRGGPASSYDVSSFCRVLRTGVDPMEIVLPRAMPQFDLSDGDCAALWAFLTHP